MFIFKISIKHKVYNRCLKWNELNILNLFDRTFWFTHYSKYSTHPCCLYTMVCIWGGVLALWNISGNTIFFRKFHLIFNFMFKWVILFSVIPTKIIDLVNGYCTFCFEKQYNVFKSLKFPYCTLCIMFNNKNVSNTYHFIFYIKSSICVFLIITNVIV